METFIDKIIERVEKDRADLETELHYKYSAQIRNHILQLFLKAQKKDKKLKKIFCGNGTVSIRGEYKARDGYICEAHYDYKISHEDAWPKHKETRDLFDAVYDYWKNMQVLPCIDDIE